VYLVRRIKKATKYTAANAATGIKVDRKAESEVEPLPEVDYYRQRLSVNINWLCDKIQAALSRVDNGLPFCYRIATRLSCAEVNKHSKLMMLQYRGAFLSISKIQLRIRAVGDGNEYLHEVGQGDHCQNSKGPLTHEAIGLTISKKIK
jgi:hypothetical protein